MLPTTRSHPGRQRLCRVRGHLRKEGQQRWRRSLRDVDLADLRRAFHSVSMQMTYAFSDRKSVRSIDPRGISRVMIDPQPGIPTDVPPATCCVHTRRRRALIMSSRCEHQSHLTRHLRTPSTATPHAPSLVDRVSNGRFKVHHDDDLLSRPDAGDDGIPDSGRNWPQLADRVLGGHQLKGDHPRQ